MKNTFLLSAMIILGFSFAGSASAATLDVSASPSAAAVGAPVTLTVTINTEGVAVNAAEATLQFSKDLLEVVSVDISDSLFNFWVAGPSFSNETGRITFLGGSTNGFNGKSLRLVRIQAKMKAEGVAEILFTDGTVAANDGSGTNVLTAMHGTTVTSTTAPVVEVAPVQIVREPTPAVRTPAAPALQIPLYPDSTHWYNTISPFLVTWDLPSDISAVATALNQNPEFIPNTSEGLFDNKIFHVSGDGIWYLHIRFKNSMGWGAVAHYRIAIDTLPPTAYQIVVEPGLTTDVPTPLLSYESGDQLSGLLGYTIKVDDSAGVDTTQSTYTLPALLPGQHTLSIDAKDQAGNSTNTSVQITTVPIASPTLSPIAATIYVGEGGLAVGGTSEQGVEIAVELRAESGELVATSTVAPDTNGTWGARFEQPLKQGMYSVTALARDSRGASSLPVFTTFIVTPRPFITFAGVQISQFWFFACILILLAIGYIIGWWIGKKRKEKRGWHMLIAQRDVGSAFDQIQKELELIIERHEQKKLSKLDAQEMLQIVKRLVERVERVKQYIIDHIEEINT